MTQNTSTTTGLTVRTAIRAGVARGEATRADQPDRPNRRKYASKRLMVSQFGVNAQGVPTFTKM